METTAVQLRLPLSRVKKTNNSQLGKRVPPRHIVHVISRQVAIPKAWENLKWCVRNCVGRVFMRILLPRSFVVTTKIRSHLYSVGKRPGALANG